MRAPRKLSWQLQRAWRSLDGRAVDLTLRLTTDEEMTVLNGRFRHQWRVTDVLTFPYSTVGVLCAGDIVIAVRRAGRQARERKTPLATELLRLAVHGLAHLAGHDHHTAKTFVAMRQGECRALLAALMTEARKKCLASS
ncbi:MAG: rRNA maturation RNase YbeY [Deltaproteobacteria bacterium]|nr:rRNA maturation RNase YbeY [Deltaproteobacteria bacterium]